MRGIDKLQIALLGLICVGILLVAASAWGQDAGPDAGEAYRPQILPECAVWDVQGRPVCGYDDLDDVRALYRYDAELVLRRREGTLLRERSAALALQVDALGAAVDALQKAETALKDRVKVLMDEAIAQNKRAEDERAKPRWGSALAWTTATVAVALLVGYVAADAL